MMNFLGKFLVLIHVAFSLLLMALGLAIFFQKIDWGWKEPRKDLGKRVPSEIDKRTAAVQGAQRLVLLVTPGLVSAQQSLVETQPRLGDNHLWYREQLTKLRSEPKPIVVKEIKFDKGAAVLDNPRSGKPVLDKEPTEIAKSYQKYSEDLKTLQGEIDKEDAKIRAEIKKEEELTFKLNGKDDQGKVVKIALYALLEKEAQAQAQIKFEKDYLQPRWINALEEIELYLGRRQQLEQTIERLKKARGVKIAP